jgi:hypothetical protein
MLIKKSSSTAKEVSANSDLLRAVNSIANSCPRVSTKTIQNWFAHCGFKHSNMEILNKTDSENDVILEIHHIWNCEEFSVTEHSLQCYNANDDCEEATVEQIMEKHYKTSEDQETNEDDMTEHERVTNQDARKFTAGLWPYFM